MRRRWVARATVLVVVVACLYGVLRVLEHDPDPVRLGLLGVVVGLAGWLVLDTLSGTTPPPTLDLRVDAALPQSAVDTRTDALVRLIESHRQSHDPDHRLHDRLVELADRRLGQRHGVCLAAHPGRAAELLGVDVVDRLTDPPSRYTLTDIEGILLRIEEL